MIKIGDSGEAKLLCECMERGFNVSIPFSLNSDYDLIIDSGERIYRTQVKTSSSKAADRNRYDYNITHLVGGKIVPYTKDEIDLIVLYAILDDDFYFLFPQQFESKKRINIYSKGNKYSYMKNRFDLL
jgi:hypothetical protein